MCVHARDGKIFVKSFRMRARAVSLMIIGAKDTPVAQCGGVKHFFVHSFFSQMSFPFSFLQLMEQERRRGLWEERLLRVQPGRRVGRPRLPHRLVSIHITYHFGCFFICFFCCCCCLLHFLVP